VRACCHGRDRPAAAGTRPAAAELGLHLVFLGPPGTGKTTVARLVGELYAALGLLERGHLIETDRGGLVGEHLGETNRKTHEQIERARGGVLFVDEAYSLVDRDRRDWFGAEAIGALLKRMEDNVGEWACVLAGHTDEMQRLLDSNPALRSRVSLIEFRDYDLDALMAIGDTLLSRHDYEFGEGARQAFEHGLDELRARREHGWGNAREVRKLIGYAIGAQARRLCEAGADENAGDLQTLRLADVQAALERRAGERLESAGESYFDW
jgi:SpoVK/Ycf46/Vps4 family AAA+-type ATPase